MIVRMWRGRAKQGQEAAYLSFLESSVFPELLAIPGSLGARVLRGVGTAEQDFVVLSYWTDLAAVTSFAGSDPDIAVVPLAAQKLLDEYDPFVQHFDVPLESPAPGEGTSE